MTTIHLFDNQGASWSSDSWASGFTDGMAFSAPYGGRITKLGWYARLTGAGNLPDKVSLWDGYDGSKVGERTPDVASSTGWQWCTLVTPIELVANRVYVITLSAAANSWMSYQAYTNRRTPPTGLQWVDPNGHGLIAYSGTPSYPTTWNQSLIRPVDVEWEDAGSTYQPPAMAADLQTLQTNLESHIDDQTTTLLSYVSSQGTPSAYSIPNQIKNAVNDASTGLGAIKGVADTIATSVGTGLKTAVDAITTTLGGVSSGMVQTLNTVSSVVDDILNDASSGLVAVLNRLAGGGGALPARVALPGTGWSKRTSTTWQGELAWAEPADLYVIHVTTVPTKSNPQIVAGVQMYWRSGWWCILNGAETGQRYFLDFEWGEATWGGRRMPGILLYYGTGWEGTIDAWDYTAP